MSEIQVEKEPIVLKTVVGSCIALCLWDPKVRIGGMAHIVMPKKNGDVDAPIGKYADTGVRSLLKQMTQNGANISRLHAMCIGGASMFMQSGKNGSSIGSRNVEAVKQELQVLGIEITTEAVGGIMGRKVSMNCNDGSITITTLQQRIQWNN
ncbi:chemotaxis protein CheD [candidate division KSB1 bacterium]|nr:chemotaxis protein CheD [candidate division KSB1 bacterium]